MRIPFNGNFPITQTFGNDLILQRKNKDGKLESYHVYAQFGYKGHNGIDYGLPLGTPVLAPHHGKVVEANFDKNGYGNYVKIENNQEGSILAHLSGISVPVGFELKEGDVVGLSGSTGLSTAPHLHWGYFKQPRNRSNGYGGCIDQQPFVGAAQNVTTYLYDVGTVIEPAVDIPVGEAPGKEDFAYGKIGPGYKAEITGQLHGYYNISQMMIGGGTGWVVADKVDRTPPYVKPAPVETQPPPPSVESTLQSQLDAMRDERDAALRREKEMIERYNTVNNPYMGFVALGYNKVEDVIKLLKTKDDTILGLNVELKQVLERNQKLLQMAQDKENEDATAIDEGIRAMQEADALRKTLMKIAKEAGTQPNLFDIIENMKYIKNVVKKLFEKVKVEAALSPQEEVKPVEAAPTPPPVVGGTGWEQLMRFFGLQKKGGEV